MVKVRECGQGEGMWSRWGNMVKVGEYGQGGGIWPR